MLDEEPDHFRLVMVNGLVEAGLRDAWMIADHRQRARRVAAAANLEHLVLDLTPCVRRAHVAGWRRWTRMRDRILEQGDDLWLLAITRARQRSILVDPAAPPLCEWVRASFDEQPHHARPAAAHRVMQRLHVGILGAC
jgi:hypothetical protein